MQATRIKIYLDVNNGMDKFHVLYKPVEDLAQLLVVQIPWEAICTRYGHSCFVDKLSSQLGPCTPYLAVP